MIPYDVKVVGKNIKGKEGKVTDIFGKKIKL